MSPSTTPSRSTRSSPGAPSTSSTSKHQLTPRSKIQALLADLDDSDDDIIKPARRRETRPTSEGRAATPSDEQATQSSDDDALTKKPKSKMILAMLGEESGSETRHTNNHDSKGEDAVKRVRRQLLGRKRKVSPAKPAMSSPPAQSPSITPPRRQDTLLARSSPSLCVSPAQQITTPARDPHAESNSDSENVTAARDSAAQSRFQALLAKKKAEREAKEASKRKEAEAKRTARQSMDDEMSDDEHSDGAGQKLTQESRPTRIASKKAREELHRNQQRIERQMQLQHQAKTKKKFTTKDLFQKLNYKGAGSPQDVTPSETQTTIADSSDMDAAIAHETPPSSPAETLSGKKGVSIQAEPVAATRDTLQESESEAIARDKVRMSKFDKGKGKAPPAMQGRSTDPLRVALAQEATEDADSDDGLDILPQEKSRFKVFDNLPQQQTRGTSRADLIQRTLAHLKSPSRAKSKGKGKPAKTLFEMQESLRRNARLQAKREREEHINSLRAKGVVIQTAEEREQEQLQLENMLERARQEAFALSKKENDEAKKEGRQDAGDALLDDEDEDEDFVATSEEEEGGGELSGSEDEGDDEAEADDEEDARGDESGNALFDEQAAEDGEEEEAEDEEAEDDIEMADADDAEEKREPSPVKVRRQPRQPRKSWIIDDDEEEEESVMTKTDVVSKTSELDNFAAAFGFAPATSNTMSLTQAFAGTMAEMDSQSQPQEESQAADSLAFLRDQPFIATMPDFEPSQDFLVADSQVPASQSTEMVPDSQQIRFEYTQGAVQSQVPRLETQISDINPTQDAGFEISRSPVKGLNEVPHSTIDTVIFPVAVPETPIKKVKGRLKRRTQVVAEDSDVEEESEGEDADAVTGGQPEDEYTADSIANAFEVMRKAARQPAEPVFDKKKSEAKNMVMEQAEESEDEYAGLGGASDDESGEEADEELKKMIDESDVKVDERQIAGLFAEKQRVEDEKRLNQLYKDITNGGLRKRRGNEFELSDSDDDVAEAQRRKQREFARAQKALFADKRVEAIAANPKSRAFFRELEDRDGDDDLLFLDTPDTQEESVPDSQGATESAGTDSQGDVVMSGALPAVDSNPLKRKTPLDDITNSTTINMSNPRGTRPRLEEVEKKPTSLADIRESVSYLIEEPHMVPDSQGSDDESDGEEAVEENRILGISSIVTKSRVIVDRLGGKRSASVASAEVSVAGQHLAFQSMSAESSFSGFKVPALLRRATTNMSTASTSTTLSSTTSSGANTPAGEMKGGIRRGGTKTSSINYATREAERRSKIEAVNNQRKESVRKVGQMRRGVLGALGASKGAWD